MDKVPPNLVSFRRKENWPGHGLICDLFIGGKYLYFCQMFNNIIELYDVKISSDAESLPKLSV